MFAYVDETGNTGQNLFDDAQPTFITGALITRSNFDVLYRRELQLLAERVGESILHANDLGLGKIEEIASGLLRILKRADARFFLSRLEKRYLATTKIVDTVFDSGENLAVPWHSYNIRPLRLLLVFKIAYILDEDLARSFWQSLMKTDKTQAYSLFVDACQTLLGRVDALPDARSRQLLSEALEWAIENPDAIYLHSNSKLARYGHLPNMVAFTNLLDGIEIQSNIWNRAVKKITHDRQMQFSKSLKYWHEMFSNASPDPLYWPGEEKHVLRKVFGSEFIMSSADVSPGIQMIDVVIWLFKRVIEGKHLGENSAPVLRYVFRRARQHDFSFDGVSRQLSELFEQIYSTPMTEEQMEKGQKQLELSESRRQQNMLEYAESKLLQ